MQINELYYNAPPSKLKLKRAYFKGFENLWEQTSLPLGNGSIGMGIMGEVKKDKIVLNHKTLWVGGPSPKRPDYCGGQGSGDHRHFLGFPYVTIGKHFRCDTGDQPRWHALRWAST